MKLFPFLVLALCTVFPQEGLSQVPEVELNPINSIMDSLKKKGIIFHPAIEKQKIVLRNEQAIKYMRSIYGNDNWKNNSDPLKKAIGKLIWFASNNPYDSTTNWLEKYPYGSIAVPWENFFVWDTLKIRIPVIGHFQFKPQTDSLTSSDIILNKERIDSIRSSQLSHLSEIRLDKPKPEKGFIDTALLTLVDTLDRVILSDASFPFKYYFHPFEADSVEASIKSLIGFLRERDSTMINLTGLSDIKTPLWINSKSNKMVRFWLKNEYSDSVTIWVGGLSRNTLGLYLEEGINFRRPAKQSNFAKAQLALNQINSSRLQDLKKNYIKPQFWKLRSESSLTLTQVSLTNWVTGGESSIATSMDITGYADYENKNEAWFSNNFARIKYGLVASKDKGVRKNMDLFETNSKLNHTAFGKFDFTAILLFKTQITNGFNYPDKTPVSKFLNPAIITFGLGLDYKPNKTTSISFAPLSYKLTFVLDTESIDQTKYGIPKNKRSLHEPGVSILVSNELKPFKTISVINRLQLFTNYIHNPQNVDVDWEMIATASLNWFTDVRFNTHLIFDDDTRTPVFDKEGNPVLNSEGNQKKTARIQFKELLGLSFVFRLDI